MILWILAVAMADMSFGLFEAKGACQKCQNKLQQPWQVLALMLLEVLRYLSASYVCRFVLCKFYVVLHCFHDYLANVPSD